MSQFFLSLNLLSVWSNAPVHVAPHRSDPPVALQWTSDIFIVRTCTSVTQLPYVWSKDLTMDSPVNHAEPWELHSVSITSLRGLGSWPHTISGQPIRVKVAGWFEIDTGVGSGTDWGVWGWGLAQIWRVDNECTVLLNYNQTNLFLSPTFVGSTRMVDLELSFWSPFSGPNRKRFRNSRT